MKTNHAAYEAAASDPDVMARIRSRLIIPADDPGGCWGWGGSHGRDAHDRQTGLRGRGRVRAHGRVLFVYRILWTAANPGQRPDELDHMCGRGADGCTNPSHLRPATRAENMQHRRGAQANNLTSGILGVCWHAAKQKWYAQVMLDGAKWYLGMYVDINDAALAARVGRYLAFPYADLDKHTTADEVAYIYSIATAAVRRNLDELKNASLNVAV